MPKKSKIISLIGILFFLVSGCAKEQFDMFGGITGIVTDAITKSPIQGVLISINTEGNSKTTGSDGRFEFKNLTPSTYTLFAQKDGYSSDKKDINISAGNIANSDFLLASIQSQLTVNLDKLDFEGDKTSLPIEIRNTGKGSLQWEIHENISWLSCSPTSGTTTTDVSTIVVTVSRDQLTKGTYTQAITVSSNGGSKSVNISMLVSEVALSVSPIELHFGEVTSSLKLLLSNGSKAGNITYSLEKSNAWIFLDRTAGTLDDKNTDTYINVSVNRAELSAGDYSGKVTVKSSVGADKVIPVLMNVKINQKPIVGIVGATETTFNSAKLTGSMISLGSDIVTAHGFCWSKTPNPTIVDTKSNNGDRSEQGTFSSILTNLDTSTKYYVRAYATNSVGTNYSDEYSFTTLSAPTIPAISTQGATEITSSTSKVGGSLTSLGNTTVTAHGIIWSTTNANLTTLLSTKTDRGAALTVASYQTVLTQLLPNTTYYYRAYATNSVGTAYGEVMSFTSLTNPVQITTEVSDITHNEAIGKGIITDLGGNVITERGICWGISTNPTILNSSAKSTATTNTFTAKITGLLATSTYHARAYVKTATNTYYGNDVSFSSIAYLGVPEVETVGIANINIGTATISVSVASDGGSSVTARGVCYATSPNPTIANNKTSISGGIGSFTSVISGLITGTTYYVRAYATNGKGTGYGSQLSFTTPGLPILSTTSATSITATTAQLGGDITFDGGTYVVERGLCYSTNPNPTTSNNKIISGSGVGNFSASLVKLKAGTVYYVRAYAINSTGTGYGNEVSFRTSTPPVLVDIDGNRYNTVEIGNQLWTVENWKCSRYNDLTIIPNITDDEVWINQKTGAYCVYGNDNKNRAIYGLLYNWYAVNHPQFAPEGWRVPTDADFAVLENYLIANGYNYDDSTSGNKIAKSMADVDNSLAAWRGTSWGGAIGYVSDRRWKNNISGFSALAGGYRGIYVVPYYRFSYMGEICRFWSSSEFNSNNSWYRSLGWDGIGLGRGDSKKIDGFSVRLVKDL